MVKNSPANAGDMGSISGSGRSPGEGYGNPFQYSCFENLMDSMKRKKKILRHWKMNSPGQKVSNMPLGKSGGKLLIVPVRMKLLGQSRNEVVNVSGGESTVWCCKEQYCIRT